MKKTLLFCCLLAAVAGSHASIRYVKTDGAAAASGTGGWANASNDLQLMINNSQPNDTIFVAGGTYKPNRPISNITGPTDATNRDNSFYFDKSLVVLGGFPATGSPGLNNRDWETHLTKLSGDLDGNNTQDNGNAYHVVISTEAVTNSFLFDGFTVADGNSINAIAIGDIANGAGWYNAGNPKISNVTFSNNRAFLRGGGWYNLAGNPQISNTKFISNNARLDNQNTGGKGGAWYNVSGNPEISTTIFSKNEASDGGAWFNWDGNPAIKNTIFSGNHGDFGGGWNNHSGNPKFYNTIFSANIADVLGGGCLSSSGNPHVSNSTFIGNQGRYGGAWCNEYHSRPALINSTISGNEAWQKGGAICNFNDVIEISNSIIHGNLSDVNPGIYLESGLSSSIHITYSLVQNMPADATLHNMDGATNPMFINPLIPTYGSTTLVGDYRLSRCSPVINMGYDDSIPVGVTTDLDDNPRRYNNGIVDMGAYEFQGSLEADTVTYNLNYGDTYTFNNIAHSTAGYFTHIFQSSGGCDSTTVLQVILQYRISGKVHNDINGMNNGNTINGNGTNAGGLNAVLINAATNTIVAVTTVDAAGNFQFVQLPQNDYKVLITAANISNGIPAITLPNGWVHTGEKTGSGTGSDGNADGILAPGTVTENLSLRFGIQQSPLAQNAFTDQQINPGSNASVNLPNNKFLVTDPANGTVARLRFTSFPSGTDNFSINSNSYSASNWPGVVEVNTYYLFGNLLMPNISIDPTTGAQNVVISYQAVDAAGAMSNDATITMPFHAITIGGIVRNNTNGMNGTPANTINGPGTNAGGLYALLSEDISNTIIAADDIGSDGTYQFSNVDKGYYSVHLSTVNPQPGAGIPPATIPQGWMPTAEHNGNGAGNDGFADSKIYIGVQAASNNSVTFGIQQPPVASPAVAISQLNPGGNLTAVVANDVFVTSDASPGAVTSLYFSGALPAGVNKLLLNGTVYSANNPLPPAGVQVATNILGQPDMPIAIDPVNGNVSIVLSYKAVDAAGMMSTVTPANLLFHTIAGTMSGNAAGDNNTGHQQEGPGIHNLTNTAAIRLNIYPNPVQHLVFVSGADLNQLKCLQLLDMQGRVLRIQQQDIANGLDMSNMPAGNYLLLVTLHDGSSQRFKMAKE